MQTGDDVRVTMTKWGDLPHWVFGARYLGRDEHGDWLGVPAGTRMSRPGADYVAPVSQVLLAPVSPGPVPSRAGRGPDLDPELGWMATFHAPGGVVEVYVDITTPPYWHGHELRAVDLDLDVIRMPSGRCWVDDEDEFADHRVRLGYPPDLVAHASVSCEFVEPAVRDRIPPYDDTPARWLALLSEVSGPGTGRPGAGPTAGPPASAPPA